MNGRVSRHDQLVQDSFQIRRPLETEWNEILEILKTVNFHHIGGEEMRHFPLQDCFVAVAGSRIVGVAGYKILDPNTAKTTLMAVEPSYRNKGIGMVLQKARMAFLREIGIKKLYTNCDDDDVIDWYIRHFGYKRTGGRIPKVESFGLPDKNEWVTLCVDL